MGACTSKPKEFSNQPEERPSHDHKETAHSNEEAGKAAEEPATRKNGEDANSDKQAMEGVADYEDLSGEAKSDPHIDVAAASTETKGKKDEAKSAEQTAEDTNNELSPTSGSSEKNQSGPTEPLVSA